MRKAKELSRAEWEQIGAKVKIAYLAVMYADMAVSKKIGKSQAETKLMDKVYEEMKEAKNQLDELVCRIDDYNHKLGDDAVRVFYGDFIGKQEGYAVDFTEELVESLVQCQKGR